MSINDTKLAVATAAKAKDPLDGDFTWLQAKAPSELHELHAALVSELTGIEVSPKQVQAMLHMHGKIQASEANRKRAGYKPRTAQSIRKGGETTVVHMDERLAATAKPATPARKRPSRKQQLPQPTAAAKKAWNDSEEYVKYMEAEAKTEAEAKVLELDVDAVAAELNTKAS